MSNQIIMKKVYQIFENIPNQYFMVTELSSTNNILNRKHVEYLFDCKRKYLKRNKYYGNFLYKKEFTSHLCHKHNIIPSMPLIICPRWKSYGLYEKRLVKKTKYKVSSTSSYNRNRKLLLLYMTSIYYLQYQVIYKH